MLFRSMAAPALGADFVGSAASEDISAFDRALAQQKKSAPAKASGSSQIGQKISGEAKLLGDSIKSGQFKNFGSDVASQRRHGNSGTPGSNASDKSAANRGMSNGASSNSVTNRPRKGHSNH